MRRTLIIFLIILPVMFAAPSCRSSKKFHSSQHEELGDKISNEFVREPDSILFVLPEIPVTITGAEERAKYLSMHYWDHFDFDVKMAAQYPEIIEQAFVDYINILNYLPQGSANSSLVHTLKLAEADASIYIYFFSLFEKYLYEPNSPFQNEEFYIPVLEEVIKSKIIDRDAKSIYRFQLEMAKKNRVGSKATNFSYTLASGVSFDLYNLKSEYTLLIFSNPGCNSCEIILHQLNRSQPLKRAFSMNSPTRTMITVLTLYPDEDISEWVTHLAEMPTNWIHGYDKGMVVTQKKLYDIKAIPTLYLLDRDKKVLLKDSALEAIESFFSITCR